MDREELVFVLRSIADDVEKGFRQAEQAVEDLGRSYEDLTDAEKRMQDANDDLRKRLDAMKKTMNSVNLESARMPRELRQVTSGFKAAASGAGAFAVAMIGIQLVAGLITKIAEAAKKAKEELAKLNEEANKMAQQTGGMAFLVNRYEELAKQVTRSKEETAEMEGISRMLVDTYGMRADAVDEEGRLILINIEYMKEQVALEERLTKLKLEQAIILNQRDTKKAIEDMVEAEASIDWTEQRIKDLKEELATPVEDRGSIVEAKLQYELNTLEVKYAEMVDALVAGNDAVSNQLRQSMSWALIELGEEADKIPPHIRAEIETKMRDIAAGGGFFDMNTVLDELRKYLDSGGKAAEEGTKSLEELQAQAVKTAQAIKGSVDSFTSLNKQVQDLNDLQVAIDVLRAGEEASEDYGDALDYLSKQYGVSAEQVLENLDVYQRDAEIKQTLTELSIILAMQEAEAAKQHAVQMAIMGDITVQQSARMVGALDDVLVKLRELSGSDGVSGLASVGVSVPRWRSAPKVSTARATAPKATKVEAYKNEALEAELALIERKRKLDQLTTAEEIQLLEKALRTLAKTTEEKEQLQDKLYQLRKDKERQAYDDSVYFGRLTLEQQREQIKAMIHQYKAGTDARIALERELYDIQQEIRARDTENLDRLAQGVITALQNRYAAHREEELTALQASMKAWGDWAQVQVDAINAQIRALDDLTKQEDRGDEETRRRRKIAALEQQLLYETDEYNRRKLEEQLVKEKDDLSKWQTRNEREDQKQALRDQATHVQDRSRAEQDALRDQMDAVNKFYDERLQAQNLAAEAEYVLMQGSQENIIALIGSYAPEYDILGQTLGEKMYEGFIEKAGAIADYIAQINLELQATQDKAAQLATQSAVEYWQGQGAPVVTQPGGSSKTTSNAVTINVYGDNQSPAQLSREMERTLDRLSRV